MRYEHTQSTVADFLVPFIVLSVVIILATPFGWPRFIFLAFPLGSILYFGLYLSQLTVVGDDHQLHLTMGPKWQRTKNVGYYAISSVRQTRKSCWVLGVRTIRDVETWSVRKWDMGVEICFKTGRRLVIGTDDPIGLERFLRKKLEESAHTQNAASGSES